jgi:hypothetical protein
MKDTTMATRANRLAVLFALPIVFQVFLQIAQAQLPVRMQVQVVKDQTEGFYYVRAILYTRTNPDSIIALGSGPEAPFRSYQEGLQSYFQKNQHDLADPSNYVLSGSASTIETKPARTERVKISVGDLTTFQAPGKLLARLPAKIVVFLIVVLDPGKQYDVYYHKGSPDEIKSDQSITLGDDSYFSPLEVSDPLRFDIEPAGGTSVNTKVVLRARDNILSSSAGYSQYRFTLEGKRISKDLDDSLHSLSASLGARLYWRGGDLFQSANFFLSAEGNATKKFNNYDYGVTFGIDLLAKVVGNTEGASISLAGEILQYRQSLPDSVHSSNRVNMDVEWHPRSDRYRIDLELKNWIQAEDVQSIGVNEVNIKLAYKYYYRILVSVLGSSVVEPFLGYEQGYLPPSFVFMKQFNAGVRFKLENSVSSTN